MNGKTRILAVVFVIIVLISAFLMTKWMTREEEVSELEEEPKVFPVSYPDYIRKAEEFKETNHNLTFLTAKWNQWYFLPWFSSGRVWSEETIKKLREAGINGGSTAAGYQSWVRYFDKLNFPFYMDQTAGRGPLHKDWDKYNRGSPGGGLLQSPFPLGSKKTI